jgi:hypothetical protein
LVKRISLLLKKLPLYAQDEKDLFSLSSCFTKIVEEPHNSQIYSLLDEMMR